MLRPALEVADIFRDHGAAWRSANAGHVSLDQLKVMTAIERCRTAALGGHVERCENCAHTVIAYNSCRNRHCPKCQGAAAREWLAERETELLPVPYFHMVFTLPAAIADIAYQNKAMIYDLLFKASSETLLTIAADPKHLGARARQRQTCRQHCPSPPNPRGVPGVGSFAQTRISILARQNGTGFSHCPGIRGRCWWVYTHVSGCQFAQGVRTSIKLV